MGLYKRTTHLVQLLGQGPERLSYLELYQYQGTLGLDHRLCYLAWCLLHHIATLVWENMICHVEINCRALMLKQGSRFQIKAQAMWKVRCL